jgi:hypothetical protein
MPNPSISDRIAINFLPVRQQEFSFAIYRRGLESRETPPQGTYSLPENPSASLTDSPGSNRYRSYAVSLKPSESQEQVRVGAWANPWLTLWVLRQSLEAKCALELPAEVEQSDREFTQETAFVLERHEDGARQG